MSNPATGSSPAKNPAHSISSAPELEVSSSNIEDILTSFGSLPNKIAAGAESTELNFEVDEFNIDDMLASFSITQASNTIPNESPVHHELKPQSTELSQSDINEMLASFAQPQSPTQGTKNQEISSKNNEQKIRARYIVNWKAIVASNEKGTVKGTISEISRYGASIYKEDWLPLGNCTLHIQVSPLDPVSKTHVMTVDGNVIYSVYDSKKNLFRTAIQFLKFHKKPDLAYLEERLAKHHNKIVEIDPKSIY